MRIGINCLRISPDYKGGVNSFTFGLLDAFAASRRAHEFVIFASPHNRKIFTRYEALPNFRITEINEDAPGPGRTILRRGVRRAFNKLWWKLRCRLPLLPLNGWLNAHFSRQIEELADIVYVPYVPTPLFPYPDIPSVYSIHDLQHVHFPEFFTPEQRLERDSIFTTCVRQASRVQATSQQMKGEFLTRFPFLRPENIPIIPEGVDLELYARTAPVDVQSRYNLPTYFLYYPAQLWHHKNHLTILKALALLKVRGIDIPLVLTGARYEASQFIFDFINEHDLSDRVYYLGLVPYDDVISLHRTARFMLTASLYEAGSIPMWEAAAAGTPIIGSAIPSHTEQSQRLKMQLFSPTDEVALAELLTRIWNDDRLIFEQVDHNRIAIHQFSWERAAEDYLDVFETLAPKPVR